MALFFKTFKWSFIVTILALIAAFMYGSWEAVAVAAILIAVECFVSLDNAIVNSKILAGMSEFWVKMFLTVGIIIAVFGVRFILPVVLVSATTGIDPISVIKLAFENGDAETPGTYGYYVTEAHPQLASVAGVFLLMLFLSWLFDEKDHNWIKPIEGPLGKLSGFSTLPSVITLVVIMIYANINPEHFTDVLVSGLIGLISFLAIDGLSGLFSKEDDDGNVDSTGEIVKKTGKAGFLGFLYLEFIDASFSMDSLGAGLAITSNIVVLMIGLGVGALYVRSMTIYFVHSGSLNMYRYLESGAMWAIGVLAFILFYTINHHVPELVTGGVGITVIGLSFIHSLIANKRDKARGIELETMGVDTHVDLHHPEHNVGIEPHLPASPHTTNTGSVATVEAPATTADSTVDPSDSTEK